MSSSNKAIIFIAAFAAMLAGFWFASSMQTGSDSVSAMPEREFHGNVLTTPRRIAIPALNKDDGSAFTQADIQGHWTLIFFGYTSCPDICPNTMNVIAQTRKKTEDFPEVVFVSVDPERDTTETLGEYVKYFDPSFTGVTGDKKMLEALTLQVGALFVRVPGQSESEYLMDHTSSILLLNPDGHLVANISHPHTPENILKALKSVKG